MKIYITGIAGFLGSHLAKRLQKLGREISGNDTLILGDLENLPNNIHFDKTESPMYIPGLFLTASRPFNTLIESA